MEMEFNKGVPMGLIINAAQIVASISIVLFAELMLLCICCSTPTHITLAMGGM